MNEYVIVEKQYLVNIANAVRESTGQDNTFNISELSLSASEIISSGVCG